MRNKQTHRQKLFDAQEGKFHWCGGRMTFTRKKTGSPALDYATFEHLKRRRDGGTMSRENIVLAHAKCNHRREFGLPTHILGKKNIRAGANPADRCRGGPVVEPHNSPDYSAARGPNAYGVSWFKGLTLRWAQATSGLAERYKLYRQHVSNLYRSRDGNAIRN